jgi:putative acetyltransferase
VIVRAERAEDDDDAIAAVVEAAFGSPDEARLVERFRASAGYLPELALVAEDGGEVVGHVLFTLTELVDGTSILMLSPLAVRPDRQRTGIGTALVREGLRLSAERTEPLVIVEGDPRYYSRFGFVAASTLGLERPYESIPEAAFQAQRLPAYVETARGRVVYPPPLAPFYERK